MSSEHINSNALRQMISKTAASRFQASKRLQLHGVLSLLSISIFSIILILVSLFQVAGIEFAASDIVVSAGQVFLSVLILCFSIAISLSDFGLKSSRHHACGVELNCLVALLKNKWGIKLSDEEYDSWVFKYFDVLEKYENHLAVDFDKSNSVYGTFSYVNFSYYIRFFLYLGLLVTSLIWLYYVFFKSEGCVCFHGFYMIG